VTPRLDFVVSTKLKNRKVTVRRAEGGNLGDREGSASHPTPELRQVTTQLETQSDKVELGLAGIQYCYNLATTRDSLTAAIGTRLVNAWQGFNRPPILHLSMHGNQRGVALTDGDFLTWHELRTLLLPLLRVQNGGLLICMSCCQGGSGVQMAMYEEDQEPAFWALVGSTRDAHLHDSAVAYITFYHLFFKDKSVIDCVEAMKVASGDTNFAIFSGRHQRDSWVAFQRKQRVEALRVYYDTIMAAVPAGSPSPTPRPSIPESTT
jgi:hypothetical protein